MSRMIPRYLLLVLPLAIAALAGACSGADVLAPHQEQPRAAERAAHDDDPTTCRSGYTIVDGRVVCNPITR